MKHTDSRKEQIFDPLNPSYHLDADDILKQNTLLLGYATKLVNDTQKKLICLQQKFNISTETQQLQIQLEIDRLQKKYDNYNDHLDFCIASTQNAMDLKTEFEL